MTILRLENPLPMLRPTSSAPSIRRVSRGREATRRQLTSGEDKRRSVVSTCNV